MKQILIAVFSLILALALPANAAAQQTDTGDVTPPESTSQQTDHAGQTPAGDSDAADGDPPVLEAIGQVLDMEVFSVDNAPVRVSNLLIAIILLIVGVFLAKFAGKYIGKRLLPRLGVEPGPAAAIQSIVFYLMLFAVVMTAFSMASVPMTVFTVFGGALALGVGFGSQNIMNNFISGLILLIERPITVGQLIEVDGHTGVVKKIGARATLIEGYLGGGYIIPNSTILENITKNWGITHDRHRSIVAVGVAYGSPTDQVAELITRAMTEHDRILDKPEPSVLFTEFGDNSLAFEAHFWCRPKDSLDRMTIESNLRFAIDRLFREADICISFPQRDVHLDTLSPLEIRVTNA